jgi:hypothetical protein
VSFSAAAGGAPAPAIQWQVSTDNGAAFNDIAGASGPSLSFISSAAQSGHRFRAVFSNACGVATTTAAVLSVNTAPVVSLNPTDRISVGGGPVSFTAAATGTPAPTIQWQVSSNGGTTFANIPGASGPSLTFTPTPSQLGYRYRAVFTNLCGTATTVNSGSGIGAGLQVYDVWLQDDSASLTVLMLNSVTGNYVFCCQAGVTITGAGKVTRKGGIITLDHLAGPDRRVMAKVDTVVGKGTASLQYPAGQLACLTITDRNIWNNTNVCGLQQN